MRILSATLVPLLVLAAMEGGLRLCGYGYATRFLVRTGGKTNLTVNEDFARQFYSGSAALGKTYPFLMAAKKPPGTTRVFILGESAALGTPEPSFGFGRILEFLLHKQCPGERFEVLNAAMRGVNSHIILPIARDCGRYEPDVFIVYMGNNELVGLHAPEPGSAPWRQNLTLLRTMQWARSLRLGQGLTALLAKAGRSESPEQNMEFFRQRRIARDDPRRTAVYANFRSNLEGILEVVSAAGARAILCTIAVNLRDFPPLGSLHSRELTTEEIGRWEALYNEGVAAEAAGRPADARERYLAASRLDDRFAELHFRLARSHEANGDPENAAKHYGLARDCDALPFRADRRINEILRETGARFATKGVVSFDAEHAVDTNALSPHQIPGASLFHDHVHFRFDGDYLMARALLPVVLVALGKPAAADGLEVPSRQECAAALAFTPWDELQIDASLVAGLAFPPYLDQLGHTQRLQQANQAIQARRQKVTPSDLEQVARMYGAALHRAPDDWQLHRNFGKFCSGIGNYKVAATQLAVEAKLFPERVSSRMSYGVALLRAGRTEEAIAQFRAALRLDPRCEPAQKALEAALR